MTRFFLLLVLSLVWGGCRGPSSVVGHGRWLTRDHHDPLFNDAPRTAAPVHLPPPKAGPEPMVDASGTIASPGPRPSEPGYSPPKRNPTTLNHSAKLDPVRLGSPDEEPRNLMPRKRWNRLAVPAFLLAGATLFIALTTVQTTLVLVLASLTLLVAGLSLKRIRKREQAGKGFALIALLVGVIALLLTGVAIAVYGLV